MSFDGNIAPCSCRCLLGKVCLLTAGVLAGCGDSGQPTVESVLAVPGLDSTPLTVEVWQQNTGPEKFAPDVLQKLRRENPELKSREEWTKFESTVLKPAFIEETGGTPPESFLP